MWSHSDLLGETIVVSVNQNGFSNSCRHVWGLSLEFFRLYIHPDLLLGGSWLAGVQQAALRTQGAVMERRVMSCAMPPAGDLQLLCCNPSL